MSFEVPTFDREDLSTAMFAASIFFILLFYKDFLGTSFSNSFQATVIEGQLVGMNGVAIPYLYLGLFDGHGGAGCAIKARKSPIISSYSNLENRHRRLL